MAQIASNGSQPTELTGAGPSAAGPSAAGRSEGQAAAERMSSEPKPNPRLGSAEVPPQRWLGELPGFRPLVGLRSSHVQTILGPYFPSKRLPQTIRHRLELHDGDSLTIHEDAPLPAWGPALAADGGLGAGSGLVLGSGPCWGGRQAVGMRRTEEPDEREPAAGHAGRAGQEGATVLLSVHGLAGCHRSTYVQRLAWHAIRRGWYSYRMDMRGAGSSGLQSRFLYHAGRSDDVLSVLRFIRRQHPTGRIFLCGFSLGGSIALHLLANLNRETRGLLDGAVVVCPPLDLGACAENIRRGFNRIYDQTFARALWKSLQMRPNAVHQLGARMPAARPKSLVDFDHLVTAPLGGYESADHYYRLFSTDQQVHRIDVPTLALFAKDDPLIPYAIAERTTWSDSTRVVATDYGGHLGFIGGCDRGPKFPTVRWLEHAVIHAIEAHLEATPLPAAPR